MLPGMSFLRRTFSHPFVSALTGGVLVAAAFLIALGAGWVGDDDADRHRSLAALAPRRRHHVGRAERGQRNL